MPAQVTTQLLDDSPAVAIIGDNSLLRQGVERLLKKASFSVHCFSLDEFLQDTSFSEQSWYKVIWLNTSDVWLNKRYLTVCAVLREVRQPVVAVLPITTIVDGVDSVVGARWLARSKLQTQVIVDCSFYLSTAAFVFGRDIVDVYPQKDQQLAFQSSLDFLAAPLASHQLLQVAGEVFPQTLDQFLFALSPLLFRPYSAVSVQIKGARLEVSEVVRSITKEYRAYYDIQLSSLELPLTTANPVPFSTEHIQSPPGGAITAFVRSLPIAPPVVREHQREDVAPLPLPLESERTPRTLKDTLFAEHPPSPLPSRAVSTVVVDAGSRCEVSEVAEVDEETRPTTIPRVSDLVESVERKNTPPLTRIQKSLRPRADQVSVQQDLQKIFQSSRSTTKTSHVQNLVQVHSKVSKRTRRKRTLFYLGVGVIGVGLGVLFLAGTFLVTSSMLKGTLTETVALAAGGQTIPRDKLTQLSQVVSVQVKSYSALVQVPQLTQAAQSVELSERLIAYLDTSEELLLDQEKVIGKIIAGEVFDLSEESEKIAVRARQAYEEISHVQGLLDATEQSIISSESERQTLHSKLETERRSLLVAQQLFPILPELFAHTGSSTYAVLFQNDQELRPTGGFIQAIGFLEFNQGVLRAVSARSSYELDKAVLGEVLPPPEIKQYLGEQRLYLRDSNWNPDFPTTAEQARWFIEKATNREIAGVFTLNTYSLALLLEAVGPLDLPEFNEVLTHKNIRERMEFHSEVILVESTGVPDYSTLVLRRILEKIQVVPKERLPQFIAALGKSLQQQQMLLYSTSQGMQSNWQALSWSGGIITPQCPTQLATNTCLVEAVAQVEANVGVNKANYYLEKEITHSVSFSEQKILHSRQMTYVNTAQTDAWPKGPYKTYNRLFLPASASSVDVLVGGRPLAPEQLSKKLENDRVIIGFYLEVPVQKSTVVTLSYTTDRPQEKNFSYAFFDQKQSGTSSTPFSLLVKNGDFQPVLIAPQAELLDGEIRFSQAQDSHLFFGVQF
jgi:hypothetical protein